MQSIDLDNCPTPIASDLLIEQGLPMPTLFGLTSARFPPGLAQCLQARWDGRFGWNGGFGEYGALSRFGRYNRHSEFGEYEEMSAR